MAQNVDFFLNLNTAQAQQLLSSLYQKGNSLFGKKGYDLNLNSQGFEKSLQNASNRILSFTSTLTVFQSVGQAMRKLTTDALQVETSIAQIQSILGLTTSKLDSFTSSIFDMANKTGLSFSEASKAAEEFSRQGLTMAQTLKATESAMALVRVSGGDMGKAVQDLNALMSAFAEQPITFERIADVLANLDASFSTTTTGLAEGLSRVSAVAAGAGIEFEKMASLIAAVKQVSGRTEAVIGNAFKSIIINLGTEKVQAELEGINIATKNADGTFRQADAVLTSLANKWDSLSDAQRSNISLKVAGKYHKNILEAALLAEKLGVTDKAVRASEDAQGSIAKRLEVLNSTTETSITRLQNSVTKLATTNLGGMFKGFVDELVKYGNVGVDALSNLFSKENPIGKAIAGGLSSVVKGPVLILIAGTIIKLFSRIVSQTVLAGRSLVSNNKAVEKIGVSLNANVILEERMILLLREQLALRQKLASNAAASKAGATATATGVVTGAMTPSQQRLAQRKLNYSQRQSTFLAASAKQSGSKFQSGAWFNIGKKQAALAKQQGLMRFDPLIAQRTADLRQQRSRRLKEGAFGASFIVPMITGAIASKMEEGKSKRLTESIGTGVSGAAMGFAFGPIVGAITTTVGAFQILSTVTEDLYGNLDDINRVTTERNNKLKEESDAGDAYVQAQMNYSQALKDGNINAIKESRKALVLAAKTLPPGRKTLIGIADNAKLFEENNKRNEETLKQQYSNLTGSDVKKAFDKVYSGTLEKGQLNITGEKKSLPEDLGKNLALTFSNAINSPEAEKQANSILEKFRQTGNQQPINDFIQTLSNGNPELAKSLKFISDNFYNGATNFSNLLINQLQYNSTLEKSAKAQADLQESTSNVNDYFRKVISRQFSEKSKQEENTASRLMTEISALDILGPGANATDTQKEDFSSSLRVAQLQVEGITNSAKIQSTLRDAIATKFQNITNLEDKVKSVDFAKKMAAPDFDISKFEDEFKSVFGDDTSKIFDTLKNDLDQARQSTKDSSDATRLAIENENLLAAARKKLVELDRRSSRFGVIGKDQSEAVQAVKEGSDAAYKYLNILEEAQKKGTSPADLEKQKRAYFTPEVAAKVTAMDAANKELGRTTPEIFAPATKEATKSQVLSQGILQMVPNIQSAIEYAQSLPENKLNTTSFEKGKKTSILKDISLLVKGTADQDLELVEKILGTINTLDISSKSKKALLDSLKSEVKRIFEVNDTVDAEIEKTTPIPPVIPETGKILEQVQNVGAPKPIEDNTRANALIEIKKKDDEIRASQIKMDELQTSLKSSTEYKQKLDEVTGKLIPLPLSGNRFQILQPPIGQANSTPTLPLSQTQTEIINNSDNSKLPFFSQIAHLFNIGPKNLGRKVISEDEASKVKDIFNNSKTKKALDDALVHLFGQTRYAALKPSFDQVQKDFSIPQNAQSDLTAEQNKVNKLQKEKEELQKKTQETDKKSEVDITSKAADVNKTTADVNNQTAKLLGEAVKFVADVKMKIEAPTFSSDVISQMTAIAKTQFSTLFKEATGKEPVLAPATQTTATPTEAPTSVA